MKVTLLPMGTSPRQNIARRLYRTFSWFANSLADNIKSPFLFGKGFLFMFG
jgi:hypothetical protein